MLAPSQSHPVSSFSLRGIIQNLLDFLLQVGRWTLFSHPKMKIQQASGQLGTKHTYTHSVPCPGRVTDNPPADQTPQKKSVWERHQGTLGKDWQPLKIWKQQHQLRRSFTPQRNGVHLIHSPASPGSSSFSNAELRLVMSSVKKLVFSIPETGETYMLLVQSLSSKFYT